MPIVQHFLVSVPGTIADGSEHLGESEYITIKMTKEQAEELLNDLAEALGKHIASEAPVSPSPAFDPSQGSYYYSGGPGSALGGHTEGLSDEVTGRGSPMTWDKDTPPAKPGIMADAFTDENLPPELRAQLENYYGSKPGGEAPMQVPDDEWAALRAARQGHAPGFSSDVGSSPGGSDRQRSS